MTTIDTECADRDDAIDKLIAKWPEDLEIRLQQCHDYALSEMCDELHRFIGSDGSDDEVCNLVDAIASGFIANQYVRHRLAEELAERLVEEVGPFDPMVLTDEEFDELEYYFEEIVDVARDAIERIKHEVKEDTGR